MTLFIRRDMPDTVFIYSLHDPETGHLRYVGKAKDLQKRLKGHLQASEVCHRTNLLKSWKTRGLKPLQFVVAEVPELEWPKWEIFYIARAKELGFDLVNGNAGGKGGQSPSKDTRDKIRASKLGEKNPNFGKKLSPDSIAKRSAAVRGIKRKPFSEAHIANLSAALKGRVVWNKGIAGPKQSVETVAKRAAANRLTWANKKEIQYAR